MIIVHQRSSEAPYLERRAARQPERRLEQAHVPNMARAVALKREARERRLERSHVRALPGCAIRRNQAQSGAIRCNQVQLRALPGCAIRCNQTQSGAIMLNYEHSQAVQSGAIRRNQVQSGAITSTPRLCPAHAHASSGAQPSREIGGRSDAIRGDRRQIGGRSEAEPVAIRGNLTCA